MQGPRKNTLFESVLEATSAGATLLNQPANVRIRQGLVLGLEISLLLTLLIIQLKPKV